MKGVLDLNCCVQGYAWGKVGSSSKVAQLAGAYDGITTNETDSYAELWMGTHPKGPATIKGTGQKLNEWLAENKWALSYSIAEKYGDLPYLFKVLSIQKALSIQAHPNKELGAILRKNNPDNYPDSNHKPEMCIALTEFAGLMGFRPLTEIVDVLANVPELRAIVGEEQSAKLKEAVDADPANAVEAGVSKNLTQQQEALKACYIQLMEASDSAVTDALAKLIPRLEAKTSRDRVEDLILTVNQDFPNDIGLFSLYFLNYVQLGPGESMFMAANEPHAYLTGDCIECMACSDNVVRAGLTPKFKDVSTLTEMLTYTYGPGQSKVLAGTTVNGNYRIFDPPIEEFTLAKVDVNAGSSYDLPVVDGPSLILVTTGAGSTGDINITPGTTLFLAAGMPLTLSATEKMTAYRAYCTL
ncbi:phosphomannose isomerase type I [Sphaeroforma arctica JP610]|uniref:Mannose-6-phosphate isomerase n=1 Tax=Sphaeroforma arctica JP610 TaxID=667725 RepID=A0A0L0FH29_9EUKA|nr:phosphomannose isomerase type I [Sphaeroforma arctica JP610]KNC76069.1 phosphomannose isomerase type I [Sphaeroforma arctica JP610]|eukprot:XP_014149971.1 phosphomannose isomerase type I [Sphaeroforma arctica JP610]